MVDSSRVANYFIFRILFGGLLLFLKFVFAVDGNHFYWLLNRLFELQCFRGRFFQVVGSDGTKLFINRCRISIRCLKSFSILLLLLVLGLVGLDRLLHSALRVRERTFKVFRLRYWLFLLLLLFLQLHDRWLILDHERLLLHWDLTSNVLLGEGRVLIFDLFRNLFHLGSQFDVPVLFHLGSQFDVPVYTIIFLIVALIRNLKLALLGLLGVIIRWLNSHLTTAIQLTSCLSLL